MFCASGIFQPFYNQFSLIPYKPYSNTYLTIFSNLFVNKLLNITSYFGDNNFNKSLLVVI